MTYSVYNFECDFIPIWLQILKSPNNQVTRKSLKILIIFFYTVLICASVYDYVDYMKPSLKYNYFCLSYTPLYQSIFLNSRYL